MSVGANSFAQFVSRNKFLIGLETIKKHRRGVLHTPLGSSPQCYRSCVGMLTIICVDTYGKGRVDIGF